MNQSIGQLASALSERQPPCVDADSEGSTYNGACLMRRAMGRACLVAHHALEGAICSRFSGRANGFSDHA